MDGPDFSYGSTTYDTDLFYDSDYLCCMIHETNLILIS